MKKAAEGCGADLKRSIKMDVREIVGNWLRANGYDGLMGDEKGSGNCSCDIEDLMPCDEPCDRCEPGYKTKCTGQCKEFDHCIASDKNYKCSSMINEQEE